MEIPSSLASSPITRPISEFVRDQSVHLMAGGPPDLGDLVAGGIQHDTGMVVILAHQALHLVPPERREVQREVVGLLRLGDVDFIFVFVHIFHSIIMQKYIKKTIKLIKIAIFSKKSPNFAPHKPFF